MAALAVLLAAFAMMTVAAPPPQSTTQRKHLMVVVSKGLPGITLYDAETDQEICKATMAPAPHEAAFSRDGKTLYVPVYSPANVGQPGPDEHMLHFIRTSDCQIVSSLDTGDFKRPHFPEEGRSGMLYITAELKESILVVDPKEKKIVGTIPTGSNTTHFFAMTKDEKKMFTSNVSAATVSVLDIPGRQLITKVSMGGGNQRMTVSPDDRWFVTNIGNTRKMAFLQNVGLSTRF